MFSRRVPADRSPNRLDDAIRARRSMHRPLVDLTVSNPTEVGLVAPPELFASLVTPGVEYYTPEPLGLRSAREAVAQRARDVDPDRVVLTSSTSEAYSQLFQLLCEPGDNVVVPAPSYPLFDHLASAAAVQVRHAPAFHSPDGWHLDLDALDAAIDDRTRAILVVSPNNPTGALLRKSELDHLATRAAARGLALIVDAVFADWLHAPPPPDRVTHPHHESRCLTFTLGGLSKSLLLPQLKLAWTIVSGPRDAVNEALDRWNLLADAMLSVNGPVQHALPTLFTHERALRRPLEARLAANLAVARRTVRDTPVDLLVPDGGWTIVQNVPRTHSDELWAIGLVDDAGLRVAPGYFFDFPTEGHLVTSLLVPEEVFADAMPRLVAFVAERSWGC